VESAEFEVRVEGVQFAAAHFATFGGKCEPLHGHSYEVAAVARGVLSEDSWVIDFTRLKAVLRGLCDRLDHRFLLQARSRVLEIDETETGWRIKTPSGTAYLLPAQDVVALPVDNTTAERLAQWLSAGALQVLQERGARGVNSLEIEVWEGPGQRASYRRECLPQA
jgi:6-pyruvoyltetrahydropterin/6-carboxytetrahydropterin synthase